MKKFIGGLFNRDKDTENDFEPIRKMVVNEDAKWSSATGAEKETVEDEWVWVTGYKGTEHDMNCQNQRYKLGELTEYEGEIELCKRGFHFCHRLSDVYNYYGLNLGSDRNKFFEVQALVKKADLEERQSNRGYYSFMFSNRHDDSKNVAKAIVFTRELTFEDLKKDLSTRYNGIESEELYHTVEDYSEFTNDRNRQLMRDVGFSELYTELIINDSHINIDEFIERARAYHAEGVSKDVMIYLLEKGSGE